MPFVEKRLSGPTQLTTSAQAIYTVPAGGQSAVIRQLVVTNVSASAATFTLYIGTAIAANALFSNPSVAANDTVIINLSQVLATGEVVRALASANSALNLTMSGVTNDGPIAQGATYIPDGAITTSKIADSAVVTQDIANNAVTQAKLASNLSGVTVTTSSLRTTAVPAPFEGQMIYETDTKNTLIYNGSSWVCVTPQSASATNQPSTSSTSFSTLTGDPSVSIQTGTKALVTLSARNVKLGSAGYCYTGFSISGATTRSASGNEAQFITNYYGSGDLGNDRQSHSTFLVTGLTAGINTFTMQHASSGGTNYTVTGRSITVVGVP